MGHTFEMKFQHGLIGNLLGVIIDESTSSSFMLPPKVNPLSLLSYQHRTRDLLVAATGRFSHSAASFSTPSSDIPLTLPNIQQQFKQTI